MEVKAFVQKKIKRKQFFASLGIGVLGVTVLNQFPFKLLKNKNDKKSGDGKIKVKINPLAVNRNKIGGKNA